MRVEDIARVRNVALVGHGQSGKTSLTEALLFATGAIERLGSVEAGTTASDTDAEEVARQISISLACLPCVWQGHKLNLLDTPGYAEFGGEVMAGLRVADAAVVVVDAAAGVEVQTERYARAAGERGLPRLVAITKLDKEHTDFLRALDQVRDRMKCSAVAVALPIGSQAGLQGVVDLVRGKVYLAQEGKETEAPVPAEMADLVAQRQEQLQEAAAEADDELTEKYLTEGALTSEEVVRGLRAACLAGKVVPVVPLAATRMVGVRVLLDTLVADLPSPLDRGEVEGKDPRTGEVMRLAPTADAPLCALVFKTTADPYAGRLSYFRVYSGTLHGDSQVYNSTRGERERMGSLLAPTGRKQQGVPSISAGDMGLVAKLHATATGDTLCEEARPILLPAIELPTPVYSVAIKAKSRGDEDKVGSALARLCEEDPTIQFSMNPETKETILSGMGDLHLEVVVGKLQRKYGVEVETGAPKIPYRETIRGRSRVQGRHKKQTGGRGQFGDVWMRFEPVERGAGFEFVDEVRGGAVPKNFIPAVEKGVREALEQGVLAGYPLTDLRVILDDGSSHPVDSSDIAFRLAAHLAVQKGCLEADPVLLEPVMEVEVAVPSEHMGDVIGVLNSKRGSILGMEPMGDSQVVRALVPLAEMATYASELRSVTGGRGSYTMRFSHYQEVPPHLAQGIIEASKQEKQAQGAGR